MKISARFLATRLGAHQPDRRIPLAKHRIHGPRETLNVGFRPLPQTTPMWDAEREHSTDYAKIRTLEIRI